MKSLKLPLFLLAGCISTGLAVDSVRVPVGFLKSGGFLELSVDQKEGYAMGLINGLQLSVLFGAKADGANAVNHCIQGMNSNQIAAILKSTSKITRKIGIKGWIQNP
jgi:hypothetical protein